jgi:hypothetical protein
MLSRQVPNSYPANFIPWKCTYYPPWKFTENYCVWGKKRKIIKYLNTRRYLLLKGSKKKAVKIKRSIKHLATWVSIFAFCLLDFWLNKTFGPEENNKRALSWVLLNDELGTYTSEKLYLKQIKNSIRNIKVGHL